MNCSPPCQPDISNFLTSKSWWGGWDSNSRPTDYENYGLALRVRYLHRYHEVVPMMALIAPFAQVARSTNQSTTTTASA